LWQCWADGEVHAVPRGSPLKAEANIVYSRFGLLSAPVPSFGDQLKFFSTAQVLRHEASRTSGNFLLRRSSG
jgi:hypothetical protein